jgi:hypothetical protein
LQCLSHQRSDARRHGCPDLRASSEDRIICCCL